MTGTLLLSFACATTDVEPIVEALRTVTDVPIHVRDEAVRGIDFADAGTSERVSGALRRAAVELIVAADLLSPCTAAVEMSRHRLPVRWRATPVFAQGRIA
jgi:hypothetical protein